MALSFNFPPLVIKSYNFILPFSFILYFIFSDHKNFIFLKEFFEFINKLKIAKYQFKLTDFKQFIKQIRKFTPFFYLKKSFHYLSNCKSRFH